MGYQIGPTESVSTAVMEAIRECGNRESPDARKLFQVVEPGALDDLFAPMNDGTPRTGGRVSFCFENHRVVVLHGEYIEVHPL